LRIVIQNQDPLKQGLKPSASNLDATILANSKSRSTKTRIETIYVDNRGSGTVTQIQNQDPLKQGLKLTYATQKKRRRHTTKNRVGSLWEGS
jgi:hypothetical protein